MPASYPICDLCEMLHTNLPKKTYVDIHQWTEDQMICEDFHDLKWFKNLFIVVLNCRGENLWRANNLDRLVARKSARVKVWNRRIYIAMALLQIGATPNSSHGSLLKM